MKAGKLRHNLEIFSPTDSPDGRGGFTRTWTDTEETVWGSVMPMSSEESYYAGQIRAGLTHKVRTRHTSTITPKTQLRLGARRLDVVSVRNIDERNRTLEILCEEVQD